MTTKAKTTRTRARRAADYGTAALLDDIVTVFDRYMIFSSEHEARVLAAQILYSWAWYDGNTNTLVFQVALYVYLCAPTEHGKTRVLELTEPLLHNSTGIGVRWTEGTLFRATQDRRTVMFDETHNTVNGLERSAILSILNAGNRAGARLPRVDKKTDAITYHDVFCPKWLAGHDVSHSLADDTVQRTVVIRPPHKPNASEDLGRRFMARRYAAEVGPLRARLEEWAVSTRAYFRSAPDPDIPAKLLKDRQAEAWEALFIIADLAGAEWGKRAREAARYLTETEDDNQTGASSTLTIIDLFKRAIELDRLDLKSYGNGKPKGRKGLRALSVKVSDGRATMRIDGRKDNDDGPRIWAIVSKANYPAKVPDWHTALHELRDQGKLLASGRGFKRYDRAWHDQPEGQTYVIDITGTGLEIEPKPEPKSEPKPSLCIVTEGPFKDFEVFNGTEG